jgi:hypothetical protein
VFYLGILLIFLRFHRLDKLIAVTAIAFYWAYKAGVIKDATIEPIKIIAKTKQPTYSIFKYGFDYLQESLQQADYQKNYRNQSYFCHILRFFL